MAQLTPGRPFPRGRLATNIMNGISSSAPAFGDPADGRIL
jgi:hypothetical protein